jgi:hypothetical protein
MADALLHQMNQLLVTLPQANHLNISSAHEETIQRYIKHIVPLSQADIPASDAVTFQVFLSAFQIVVERIFDSAGIWYTQAGLPGNADVVKLFQVYAVVNTVYASRFSWGQGPNFRQQLPSDMVENQPLFVREAYTIAAVMRDDDENISFTAFINHVYNKIS